MERLLVVRVGRLAFPIEIVELLGAAFAHRFDQVFVAVAR